VRATRVIRASLLATTLAAVPLSSASAHWYHHHYGLIGGLFGFAGAVVGAAATIATAPIAIIAHAASGPDHYGPARQGYYAPPPAYGYRGYEGPPQAYYGARENYPPPDGYAFREDRSYGRPGYDEEAPWGYGGPRYSRREYNQRFGGEGPPPDDYASREDRAYGPPREYDHSDRTYDEPPHDYRDEQGGRFDSDRDPDGGYGPSRDEDRDYPSDDAPSPGE